MGMIVVLCSTLAGDYIDTHERLGAVRKSLMFQNLSVAFCCMCLGIILYQGKDEESGKSALLDDSPGIFVFLVTLVILSGGVATLASVSSTLAVEKDWVKTVCRADSTVSLRLAYL